MPKVYIKTFGCQMNDRDSEALAGIFLEKGWSLTAEPEDADVILVNTCSVREHAENRAISFLGSLKRLGVRGKRLVQKNSENSLNANRYTLTAKPVIGLIGCMARNRGKELFKKMNHIDLVCGPSSFDKVFEYVDKIKKEKVRVIDLEDRVRNEEFYHASFRVDAHHAQVVISTGCSNYCSYCVVPFVRGNLRPRHPDDIIREIERNLSLGIKRITLLGQNVNDYNYAGTNFVKLLEKITKIEELKEIDFVTSHPKNTSKELFYLMASSPKIRKHLHLPFQSGSNRILALMNRGYTREFYLNLVKDYKKIVKGSLSTDIIVGFPYEDEEDFNFTKQVLEEVRFRYAYIFKYSPRPNTKAYSLGDDVPEKEKERRHAILLNLQKEISKSYDN
ncbi:MAG: tRNA (N6-isopentenyl adenosine(37)-C2)-methylthiotransferase MiaB [Candidatus Omnitrophota bacterium]|nr:MAG: tRNA (N6-isopentenyl adenosine(37)-C2)-methylthiotransferase MiaB [Candidatus Omnitrophota bacterium]